MISMTGFGYVEKESDGIWFSVEIKTVNSRYLDLSVNLPASLSMLENQVQKHLQKVFRRGRIDTNIRMRGNPQAGFRIDLEVARQWKNALDQLSSVLDAPTPVSLDMLINKEGVFKHDLDGLTQIYWPIIESLLELACQQVNEDRLKEGMRLANDIGTQLTIIEQHLEKIEVLIPQIKREVEKNLRDRFKQIVGDNLEESRVLTEVAAWVTKADINEEVVRLSSHLQSFSEISGAKAPVGKKLDFLCQEMGREINTMGVKSPNIDVSSHTVEMKDALEKIREQLKNVE